MKNKTVGTLGWLREQAEKDGFDSIRKWQNWKRYGKDFKNISLVEKIMNENKIKMKDIEMFYRFWSKVDIKDNIEECWNWKAYVNKRGYGTFKYNCATFGAHRMAYVLTKGLSNGWLQVQHLCNNGMCCNPSHLELGDNCKNVEYMIECERQSKGEKNGQSKLTEDQVREVHKLYNELRKLHPGYRQWQFTEPIAQKFNITKEEIGNIIHGRNWHYIYEEFHN